MITAAHIVVYSKDAEADRAFFRSVLSLRAVDAGHGWLIFALPAAEAAFHPSDHNRHELFLTCDDLKAEMAALERKGARFGDVAQERWGLRTRMLLPGGGEIGLYQPSHPVAFKVPKRRASSKSGGARAKARRSKR